jgi:undecaprenyl diphosphate synthase
MDADRHRDLDDEQLARLLSERGGLPRHVAIIMDGNGRWARRRCLPRAAGHRAGRHSVRAAVKVCSRLKIEFLTLYTFSRENFRRPASEVQALWTFLEEALVAEQAELREHGVRLRVSGDQDLLPPRAQSALREAQAMLEDGLGLVLNLALAYGGRQEILRAVRQIADRVAAGELDPGQIDEAALRGHFYQPDLPDPDLVIRTSGECRLSNFLLWQAAYAELLISPVLWPDFRERELLLALDTYLCRERRYGGLTEACQATPIEPDPEALDPSRWKRLLGFRS